MCSSTEKGPSCRSLRFLFGCPRKKRFVVTTYTLSPLTKYGAVGGFERACTSSLCGGNTEQERVLHVTVLAALTRLAKPELNVAC
jgi:hypothetical protein